MQMQTKQMLLMALTQAPDWSHGQKLPGPLPEIPRSAVGKVGMIVCVCLLYLPMDVDFTQVLLFPIFAFPSLCWGVGIWQHLEFLRLPVAHS